MTETTTKHDTKDAKSEEPPPEPNVHLFIVGPDEVVSAVYDMVAGPGSAIAINGFHGSQVYELSPNDTNLQVKLVNVTDFAQGALPKEDEEPAPGMYTEPKPEELAEKEDAPAAKSTSTTTKSAS